MIKYLYCSIDFAAPAVMKINVYAYNISQPNSLVDSSAQEFKEMSNAICQDVSRFE